MSLPPRRNNLRLLLDLLVCFAVHCLTNHHHQRSPSLASCLDYRSLLLHLPLRFQTHVQSHSNQQKLSTVLLELPLNLLVILQPTVQVQFIVWVVPIVQVVPDIYLRLAL